MTHPLRYSLMIYEANLSIGEIAKKNHHIPTGPNEV